MFGTNPFRIEYDGQVMAEGQTGTSGGGGGGGFNVNWDADWTVRARITARGWEVGFAIPLLQYNRQAATFASNVRLALLNRSGTGFFLVYNDRRDTSAFTADELLGRSVVAKFTRLFDF